METQRVYQANAADWQNRLRIANYVGTMATDNETPSLADVAIKVACFLGLLALALGALS